MTLINNINKYPPGTFNWADLATSDAKSAIAFYNGLFDWTAQDISVGSGIFTMLSGNDKAAASLYQLSQGQRVQGIPSHWMAYVAVTSVDETAEQAQQLGGQVLVPPFDLVGLGRMALLLDPTGAPFAVWQAGRHVGSQLVGQSGTIAWNDLITSDPLRAIAFYTQLFGWQVNTFADGFWAFSRYSSLIAGVKRPLPDLAHAFSHWRVYFVVADSDAGAARALALGGDVLRSSTRGFMGYQSVIQDPLGAEFGLINLADLPKNAFINALKDKRQAMNLGPGTVREYGEIYNGVL